MTTNLISSSASRTVMGTYFLLGLALLNAAGQDGTTLVHRLAANRLNPYAVYAVQGQEILLPSTHIVFERGVIAFTEEVDGRVTGALFQGEGEVLIHPPADPAVRQMERESLALFTGSALLDQHFSEAYFAFSDDEAFRWRLLREHGDEEFAARWSPAMVNLERADALALASAMLNGQTRAEWGAAFLHARFSGTALGSFDLVIDGAAPEAFMLCQAQSKLGQQYMDTWMRFPLAGGAVPKLASQQYKITADVSAHGRMKATAALTWVAETAGERVISLQFSRDFEIESVSADGKDVPFIQNESLQGSELARRGDDAVTVFLPAPLPLHQPVEIVFRYAGAILSDAGNGLMFMRARGMWYPNRGPEPADFDLRFTHPAGWSVLATGEEVAADRTATSSHWRASGIPLAGFNVGEYRSITMNAGSVTVEAYVGRGVETRTPAGEKLRAPLAMPGAALDPNRSLKRVAGEAAQDIAALTATLGAFPLSRVAVTQQPGAASQGWPGLIYLSSLAFVAADDPLFASRELYGQALYGKLMLAHELAHQWWGDRVGWHGERDVWLVEALANYSALMALEKRDPKITALVLDYYRRSLLDARTVDGKKHAVREAGPVTLGFRLNSSKFPDGYDEVAYGRGTWLLHMLRMLLREEGAAEPDARFISVLHSLAASPQRVISATDVQRACENVIRKHENYEEQASLDWFFTHWVNGSAIPRLELKNVHIVRRKAFGIAKGELLQEDAPAQLVTPVAIYADLEDKPPLLLGRIYAETGSTALQLRVPLETRGLLLDPRDEVLRQK